MEARMEADEGDQVFNNYGHLSNSELLLHYGFSLQENQDENVKLFHSLDEVLTYFVDHLAHTKFVELDLQWAKYVAEKSVKEVGAVEGEKLQEVAASFQGPEWQYVDGSGFSAWQEGRVEPRLVAALAGIGYYELTRRGRALFIFHQIYTFLEICCLLCRAN